jgi:hypothetical protein
MNTPHESTYALLVRSEEKKRSVLEIVLFAVFILSAVASIVQFAYQPVQNSAPGLEPVSCVSSHLPDNAG